MSYGKAFKDGKKDLSQKFSPKINVVSCFQYGSQFELLLMHLVQWTMKLSFG